MRWGAFIGGGIALLLAVVPVAPAQVPPVGQVTVSYDSAGARVLYEGLVGREQLWIMGERDETGALSSVAFVDIRGGVIDSMDPRCQRYYRWRIECSRLGPISFVGARGGPGDDVIESMLPSGWGATVLWGDDGADVLTGAAGNDRLEGGAGTDRLDGAAGADHVIGGSEPDRMFGRDGEDLLDAREGAQPLPILGPPAPDTIVDCGAGEDQVVADPRDRPVGCEAPVA